MIQNMCSAAPCAKTSLHLSVRGQGAVMTQGACSSYTTKGRVGGRVKRKSSSPAKGFRCYPRANFGKSICKSVHFRAFWLQQKAFTAVPLVSNALLCNATACPHVSPIFGASALVPSHLRKWCPWPRIDLRHATADAIVRVLWNWKWT